MQRNVELPVPAGDLMKVRGARDRVLYTVRDQAPDEGEYAPVTIGCLPLGSPEPHVVVRDVDEPFTVSQDGSRVLYRRNGTVGIVTTDEEHVAGDGALPTDDLMAWVDLRAEWLQIYNESWRIARDYFYDPGMNGLDWKAIGDRYRPLVAHVSHRNDLNYLLSEMLGELATSHLYVSGGDMPETPEVNVGLLGVDWSVDDRTGIHRFAHIYRERDWNSGVVPPLAEPGLDVHEGDYLLAVNGRPVKLPTCVFEPFGGTVGHPTELLVGRTADDPAPRTITVTPIADDMSLRYAAWVRAKRERVTRATGGRVGYVHIPTTSYNGFAHFAKDLYPQSKHDALIVDDRFNRGGVVPDFFIRALSQRTWNYASNRDGEPWHVPDNGLDGPQCLIINSYAGSGGDLIADLYRQARLGPIIGHTTGGNLVGTWRWPTLVDGGQLSVPDFGLYDTAGHWIGENHGVEPDLPIENAPESEADGADPQLDRAIEWTLEQLRQHPVQRPGTPTFNHQ
jgi:tricorn protease